MDILEKGPEYKTDVLVFEFYKDINRYLFFFLVILGIYLLIFEFIQLFKQGFLYFLDFWNYIDVLPISFLLYLDYRSLDYTVEDNPVSTQRSFAVITKAFASMLLFFKLIYFLRSSKSLGWLIRLVIEVILDMKEFFIVVLVMVIAFSCAFLIIGKFPNVPLKLDSLP